MNHEMTKNCKFECFLLFASFQVKNQVLNFAFFVCGFYERNCSRENFKMKIKIGSVAGLTLIKSFLIYQVLYLSLNQTIRRFNYCLHDFNVNCFKLPI